MKAGTGIGCKPSGPGSFKPAEPLAERLPLRG